MYGYRLWHQSDLPFMAHAASNGAWESLSAEERSVTNPMEVAQLATQQLREVLGSGSGTALLATYGHQPVGYLLAALAPDSSTDELNGHVMMIWVTPAHRRRGLARHLQAVAEGLFERAGVRKAKVWTGLHNQPAVRLAQQMGYQPEGLIGMKAL